MMDKVQLDRTLQRQLNQTAYRLLKEDIRRTYPPGRFVAIYEGRIVGDAARVEDFDSLLRAQGIHPPDALVVEAGVDYPEYMIILTPVVQG